MNAGKRVPRDFWAWLAVAAAAVGSGYAWQQAHGGGGLCWLLLSAVGVAYLAFFTLRHIETNRPSPEAPAYPTLGAANHLSLLRGLALALLPGFFCPRAAIGWLPGALYTFVALTDWWDGFLARITRHTSRLGEMLDLHLDGLGVLIASGLAVALGRLPWWYLAVGLARYAYVAYLALLRWLGRNPVALPPDPQRRANAGLMMAFLAVALWPVFPPQGLAVVGLWFFIPFIGLFLRDAFQAGKAPAAAAPRPQRAAHRRVAAGLAGLRWLAAAGLTVLLWHSPAGAGVRFGGMLAALMLALGVLPRVSALGGLLALGFGWAAGAPLSTADALLSAILTAIAFYGGGSACLWAPDDRVFLSHIGGAPSQTAASPQTPAA